MKRLTIACLSVATLLALSGCSEANIESQIRESPSNSTFTMRCTSFPTGNDMQMNKALAKYQGWKMVYSSEYTTDHESTTALTMCFEK